MSEQPRLLDLFCGAGGAGMGYHRAGYDVTGVDIRPQPNYPFGFVQSDALEYAAEHGAEFDLIHASPPCQAYCVTRFVVEAKLGKMPDYPDLVAATRDVLRSLCKPYVIENVPGAPLIDPIMLCGEMFGLRVFRHRLFEIGGGCFLLAPPHPKHPPWATTHSSHGQYSSFANGATHICVVGNNFCRADGMVAMGVDWKCTKRELTQMIPPAYTEWIGGQMLNQIKIEGKSVNE